MSGPESPLPAGAVSDGSGSAGAQQQAGRNNECPIDSATPCDVGNGQPIPHFSHSFDWVDFLDDLGHCLQDGAEAGGAGTAAEPGGGTLGGAVAGCLYGIGSAESGQDPLGLG